MNKTASQALFTAMEMRHAGQVDKQSRWIGNRNGRRPAARQKLGKCLQLGRVPFKVGGMDGQSRNLGAGHGQRHARPQPKRAGSNIGGSDFDSRADLVRSDQRQLRRLR